MKRPFQYFLSSVLLTFCATIPHEHGRRATLVDMIEYSKHNSLFELTSIEDPGSSGAFPSQSSYFKPVDFSERGSISNKKIYIPEYVFPEIKQPYQADFRSPEVSYPSLDTPRSHVHVTVHFSEQRQPSAWEPSEQFLEKATVEQFWYALCRMYGSQIHNHHIDILKTLKWYRYNSFIEIIKTFPEYDAFILALEKQLHEVFFKRVQVWWHGAKEKILLLKREIVAQKLKEEQEQREMQEREHRHSAHIAKINAVLNSERSNLVSLCDEYKIICENDFITDQQRDRYENRTKNIEQFLQQGSQLYDASYIIDDDTIGLLTEHNLSKDEFVHCLGNKLQQAVHEECVDALNQFARKYKTVSMPCASNLMMDSALLASRFAKSGYVSNSFTCADLCWALVDCGQAVVEGMVDGASNVLNMVIHPIDTAKNMICAPVMIIKQVCKTLYHLGALGTNYCINPELGKQQWNEYCDEAEKLCNQMGDQLKNITPHGAIRTTSAFITEAFLMTKLLSSANKVCRIAKGNLIELVKSIEATETVMVTAEGIPVKISTNSNVQKFSTATKEVIKDSRKILESLHANFMQNIKQEVTKLRKLFDNTIKGFAEFSNKYIKIDYEHIFGMELNFLKRGAPKISGFHHDLMGLIEKGGRFEFVNKIVYENGVYEAILYYENNMVKNRSAFFPIHWSREKVVDKIYEAYENFIKGSNKIPTLGTDGKYMIDAMIEGNIEIRMHITRKGVITSAYPILK